jgi:hypothetical protein
MIRICKSVGRIKKEDVLAEYFVRVRDLRDWVHQAEDSKQQRATVITVMNFSSSEKVGFSLYAERPTLLLREVSDP